MTESITERPSEQVDREREHSRASQSFTTPPPNAAANGTASESNSRKKRPWQEVVADKVAIRDTLIQAHFHSDMTMQVENITSIDHVGDMTKRLDAGEFTAEEVIRTYIKRSVNSFDALWPIFKANDPREPAKHTERSVRRCNCNLWEDAN